MSLILEALKKSEAERRLGQAPGLLTPAPPVRRRHGLWPLLLVLVLAVLLSTGITWWLLRPAPATVAGEPATPAAAGSAPSANDAPAAEAPTATPVVVAPAPAAAPPAQRPAPPPTQAVRPPVERESAAVVAGATLPGAADTRGGQGGDVPSQQGAPEDALHGADGVARQRAHQDAPYGVERRGAGQRAHQDAPYGVEPRGAGQRMAEPGVAQVAEPAVPAVPEEPPVASLRSLPGEVQAALPPLKLSMHVFNEDPAQRFVLIDGRRYGEGMALADGLVLEAIRRDGVVLVFRGHRFHLPRPG